MPNVTDTRPEHLFLVRLWCERSQASPPGQWRGAIEHVPSGQRAYFCALGDVEGFIACQLAAQPAVLAGPLADSGRETACFAPGGPAESTLDLPLAR